MTTELFVSAKDQGAFRRMKRIIADGQAIAFVGAGMSARAGFADWDRLLQKLSSHSGREPRQAPSTEDLSWWADRARARMSEAMYQSRLREYFGRAPRRDPAIDAFAQLGFSHIFTTNYDRSIEEALRRSRKATRRFERLDWRHPPSASRVLESFRRDASGQRCLIHLHGRYDRPERIVLSERDYQDAYVRSDETSRRLFAIFSLRPVVFFGYSLRDLDVLGIFRQVLAANHRARNFAILPAPDSGAANLRARLTNRYGIEPVFYVPGGETHPNFGRLVSSLAGRRWQDSGERTERPKRVEQAGTWASRASFVTDRGRVDPEDPQKGRFGGRSLHNGRRLTAKVTPFPDDPDWFTVEIEVRAVGADAKPLKGKVDYWVHDSFPREHYYSFVNEKGVARYSFTAFGAFTLGATCDGGRTPLELDLSKLAGAPRAFRTR